jgi:hypothetical protein
MNSATRKLLVRTVYSLYWYKSTNSDAAGEQATSSLQNNRIVGSALQGKPHFIVHSFLISEEGGKKLSTKLSRASDKLSTKLSHLKRPEHLLPKIEYKMKSSIGLPVRSLSQKYIYKCITDTEATCTSY